jgi:hypothetical protein
MPGLWMWKKRYGFREEAGGVPASRNTSDCDTHAILTSQYLPGLGSQMPSWEFALPC